MLPYEVIRAKRDAHELSGDTIRKFVLDYVAGDIPDYQMSAFLMAVLFNGMSAVETTALTEAYIASGKKLEFKNIGFPTSDKHSTGGIGDKVSLVLSPMLASCGVGVPMISGRGLGHTGGTLDKLESIPGFRTNLSPKRCEKILDEVGFFIAAQSDEMVPADRKIYALRDVTATVESIPLIVASIMSKKLSEGTDSLVLDVKFGNGAFMKNLHQARNLASAMVDVGNMHGVRTAALLTDMNQPLGEYAGNTLEVLESIQYLRGDICPHDLHEITIALGAVMLVLTDTSKTLTQAKQKLEKALKSGDALEKFGKFIQAQGGNPRVIDDIGILPHAKATKTMLAPHDAWISEFDTFAIGMLCVELGAGRSKIGEKIDHSVGLRFLAKRGEHVANRQPIATVYATDERQANKAIAQLKQLIRFSKKPVRKKPLIRDIVSEKIMPFSWQAKI